MEGRDKKGGFKIYYFYHTIVVDISSETSSCHLFLHLLLGDEIGIAKMDSEFPDFGILGLASHTKSP